MAPLLCAARSALQAIFGLALLMDYMLFIIWKLARDASAGRVDTLVLFFVPAFGMAGFIAELIIQWLMAI